jgi:(2Fe-2S) ferredoxin
MTKPFKHIFVCASFRAAGSPQGVCHKKGAMGLLPYLENELMDRDMGDVAVTATGCLNACEKGPVIVIHPDNIWYGGIEGEGDIDDILDALQEGKISRKHELI